MKMSIIFTTIFVAIFYSILSFAETTLPNQKTYTDPVTGMEFIYVPTGCFQMGDIFGGGSTDETPVHKVCVDGFYIGKYEVTQAQWQLIMGTDIKQQRDKAYKKWPIREQGDNFPMYYISWSEANEFIAKLATLTNKTFMLPTEAEWEFACRSGGKMEKYCGGNEVNGLGWYESNSARKTHPVGSKASNGLGIYDMSGNVSEWVQDWKGDYSSLDETNPTGPETGSYRVTRGGSWGSKPRNARSTNRLPVIPNLRYDFLGFRLVMPPGQQ